MTINKLATCFVSSSAGSWRVTECKTISGECLLAPNYIDIVPQAQLPLKFDWLLTGVSSHARYTNRYEKDKLNMLQEPLGRPRDNYAALIPIKKSEDWWTLTQDERREIFESKSKHIANSLKYLPAIARKLYHSRDLGEPFDFITWFEFSSNYLEQFDSLLAALRASEEWKYVVREVDIRLTKCISFTNSEVA